MDRRRILVIAGSDCSGGASVTDNCFNNVKCLTSLLVAWKLIKELWLPTSATL